jgi:signal transduction histidine kinase
VQDNGIGIDPKDQARLFEMFTRVHAVQVEGLGLGLSIVHRIVTRLGGQVGVISTPGAGSTFWFTLPLSL